jgi:MOSC domain-containing protein YiiM
MSKIKPSVAEKFAEHVAYHRRLAEIERSAAGMGSSPRDIGIVEMIVCRPAVDQRTVLREGMLDTRHGLVGDSWETRGASTLNDGADPLRQITVMNSRALASIAGDRDRWQLAGDQLIVDLDLSIDNLPAGTQLQVGEAVLEVTEPPHNGCAKFAGRFGADALAWANGPEGRLRRRRGMHARVLESGTVRQGAAIRRLSQDSRAAGVDHQQQKPPSTKRSTPVQ